METKGSRGGKTGNEGGVYVDGGVWELPTFEISLDRRTSNRFNEDEHQPCRHAVDVERFPERQVRDSIRGHMFTRPAYKEWTVPRVLVAYNEGGYCSTGICADCARDALNTLDEKRK